MGSQITLTMSLVMIALFSLALFGFAIGFAADNNAEVSVADDAEISSLYIDTSDSVTNLEEDVEGTYQSILEPLEPGSEVAQSPGRFSGTLSELITLSKNIIFVPYRVIFGSGKGFSVFFTIFGTIIVLLFGLYAYKTLRGNP